MEKSDQNRLWVLPLLLAIVLGGVLAVRCWQPAAMSGKRSLGVGAEPIRGELVELEIDAGEGTPLAFQVPWEAGATVQDALAGAGNGKLSFAVQGRNAGALLTELAGYANEGEGGRNWHFEVNGEWADRSFAVYELQPGDHVLWKFAEGE